MDKGFVKRKTIIISAAVAATLALTAVCAAIINPGDKIARGVSAGGVDLGGMSIAEAENVLLTGENSAEKEFFIYTAGGDGTWLSGADISLCPDAKKTAESAFAVGRSGNAFKDAAELAGLRLKKRDIGCEYSYDKERLAELIYAFGAEKNGEQKNYILEYSEDAVTVRNGTGGQSKDVSGAVSVTDLAIRYGISRIFVQLKAEMPPVANLRSLYNEIYLEPKDAFYEVTDSGVVITPEVVGRQIDMLEAAEQIGALRRGETVTLRLVWLKPEVTVDVLNEKLFNHVLAQYTTAYSAADKSRSANVALAASKLNGIVLAPGEIFSFNDLVGPRTAEAGFRSAPVFENGETVQGMGGGVCQVSSTLYSAVLYADLEVVSRRNHSMTVAYVPKGQDATVSYGAIDFKFKNNTAYPIKISASATGGKMSVAIRGTAPKIEKTVKIVHNMVSVTEPTVEEVQNPSLAVGIKKVISSGKAGYTVTTARIVLENGYEVKNESLGTSTYKMVPARVYIGTKVPDPLPTLPPLELPPEAGEPSGGEASGAITDGAE